MDEVTFKIQGSWEHIRQVPRSLSWGLKKLTRILNRETESSGVLQFQDKIGGGLADAVQREEVACPCECSVIPNNERWRTWRDFHQRDCPVYEALDYVRKSKEDGVTVSFEHRLDSSVVVSVKNGFKELEETRQITAGEHSTDEIFRRELHSAARGVCRVFPRYRERLNRRESVSLSLSPDISYGTNSMNVGIESCLSGQTRVRQNVLRLLGLHKPLPTFDLVEHGVQPSEEYSAESLSQHPAGYERSRKLEPRFV